MTSLGICVDPRVQMGVFREKENCGPCWGKSGVFVASLTLCYSGGTVLINLHQAVRRHIPQVIPHSHPHLDSRIVKLLK